jgi:hypothetical protein
VIHYQVRIEKPPSGGFFVANLSLLRPVLDLDARSLRNEAAAKSKNLARDHKSRLNCLAMPFV